MEHAGGYTLERSATSSTGYRGVTKLPSLSNPFQALAYGHVVLGNFGSALEAAMAVARHKQDAGLVGIGSAVRVTGGGHAGGEGVVTGSNNAWTRVRLAGGEVVSVRMMHLVASS